MADVISVKDLLQRSNEVSQSITAIERAISAVSSVIFVIADSDITLTYLNYLRTQRDTLNKTRAGLYLRYLEEKERKERKEQEIDK